MSDNPPAETIRALFRQLPGGKLRLRKPPTAKIDQRVLLQVFAPAQSLKGTKPQTPSPTKPVAGRRSLHIVPRSPKK